MFEICYALALAFAYLILAVLSLSVFLIPWMMMRQNKILPAVVTPECARQHLVLVCVVRVTELLLGGLVLAGILLIGFGFLLQLNPFQPSPVFSPYFSVTMLVIILLLGAYFLSILMLRFPKSWRDYIRGFLDVNTNSVGLFAFVFAAFVAHDVYHFLPPSHTTFKSGPPGPPALFLERDVLWILVFWVVWHLSRSFLLRLLKLK